MFWKKHVKYLSITNEKGILCIVPIDQIKGIYVNQQNEVAIHYAESSLFTWKIEDEQQRFITMKKILELLG